MESRLKTGVDTRLKVYDTTYDALDSIDPSYVKDSLSRIVTDYVADSQ